MALGVVTGVAVVDVQLSDRPLLLAILYIVHEETSEI